MTDRTPPQILVLPGAGPLPESLSARGWPTRAVEADALAALLAELTGPAIVVTAAAQVTAVAEALAPAEPAAEGLHVVEIGGEPAPAAEAQAEGDQPSPGWKRGLAAMGGSLGAVGFPPLPDGLSRLAPVREVLEQAGQRAQVTTEHGETWVACGYPDLLRARSKVLLVREASPNPEIIALHRFPAKVGVVAEREGDGYLPAADWDPDPLSEDRTGRRLPQWGELFALESDTVYIRRGGRVYSFDGSWEREVGTPSQALSTLVLRWSQR